MKGRSNRLTSHRAVLLGSATLLMLLPSATALAADLVAYKSPVAAPDTSWYMSGTLEAGVNFFLQEPGSGFGRTSASPYWLTPSTSDSFAKMDEYGEVPRNFFLQELGLQAGRKDGRYAMDFWADNVGRDNQRYYFGFYETGRQYLSLGWDETPHLLSSSAKSIFGGVGSSRLTVDPATRAFLQSQMGLTGPSPNAQTQAQRNNIDDFINGRNAFGGAGFAAPISNIELKTLREKFNASYRNTMVDNWDFNVNYSNEHRTGTRPLGIGYGYAMLASGNTTSAPRPSTGAVEVPQPLDDRTQNVDAGGQYSGTTPWGTPWTTSVKYSGSFFNNDVKSIDVDNPFCVSCVAYNGVAIPGGAGTQVGPNLLRYGLYADNSANGVTWNNAVQLPFLKSRYVSTLQYTAYRQNDPFIDTATNGITTLAPLPRASLNGEVNALLSNNVLTSRLTDNVTNTARIRYYDVNDRTPPITLTNYVYGDGGTSTATPLTRNSTSYKKLNINDEVKWRVNKQLTVGGGYFFEKWTPEHSEVDHLTEHAGKVFVNFTPSTWLNTRTSYLYSERRYGEYEDTGNVQTRPLRLFFVANRNRHKAESHIDISVSPDVTITPNGGLRWDDYPDGVPNLLGTTKDHTWNVGSDLSVRLAPDLRFTFSYNYEEHQLHMAACCGNNTVVDVAANTWTSDITQRYHTFIAAANWNAIPGKLDFKVDYLVALANEANLTTPCTNVANTGCTGLVTGITNAQFPDEKNRFERFSVLARYFVDPDVVRRMGWNGEVVTKLRYIWERNHNTNWATDTFSPYSPSPFETTDISNGGRSLFLAYANPNYTAQILAASVAFKW